MHSDGVPALSLDAELRLLIDGAQALIEAKGQQVTLRTDNVGQFLAQAIGSARALPDGAPSLRHLVGQIGRTLDELGLSARIVGPKGTVVEVGHRSPSRLGRMLTGSGQLSLGPATALAQAASGYVWASTAIRRRLALALAATVVAVSISSRLRSRVTT